MSSLPVVPYAVTLRVRDECLCLHVQRAARALARRFDQVLRPAGLTNGQFSVLMALNRPAPPDQGAVAELLAMDRTTLTAALKPLERRGLVDVAAHPNDRRRRVLVLTPLGRAALAEALPLWQRAHQALEQALPGGDAESLRASLRALAQRPGVE
jgi:DNA-binding MarR family transcriptional regulator